jgi:hypothetical protein
LNQGLMWAAIVGAMAVTPVLTLAQREGGAAQPPRPPVVGALAAVAEVPPICLRRVRRHGWRTENPI